MQDEPNTKPGVIAVDWDEVRGRIESVAASLEHGRTLTEEERSGVLRERARELARRPLEDKEAEEHIELVIFSHSGEQFAVESAFVQEVFPVKSLTRVPCTPPFIAGIVNVRGRVCPVLDVGKLFDMKQQDRAELGIVIVVEHEGVELGILADGVTGVIELPVEQIQPTPPNFTGFRAEYLQGVTDEPIAVLDARKMVADSRITVHEEVTQTG